MLYNKKKGEHKSAICDHHTNHFIQAPSLMVSAPEYSTSRYTLSAMTTNDSRIHCLHSLFYMKVHEYNLGE